MMNLPSIAAAALLSLALLPLCAAAQEEPADTVRLRFGWTAGMRADVEYEHVRVRSVGGERDSTRMASVYRLEVDPHAEGLTVRYADMRWTELPRIEGPAGQFFDALGRTSSGGKARMVVSRDGEFLRAEGMEEVAQELRRAAEPMMAEMQGEGLEVFRDMMAGILSEEGMAAAAANEWSSLVEAWIGADMEVRAVYEEPDSLQVPFFPGVVMPVQVLIQMLGQAPCDEAGDDAACVEIFTTSVPDEEAFRQAVGGFLRQAGLSEAEMEELLAQLQVETLVTLVTEPGTLRPWLLETTRTVSGGEDAPLGQVETETYRFRWRP
jgi:hypothetical protein